MTEHEHIIDADGVDITIGSTVVIEDVILGGRTSVRHAQRFGRVTVITDVDGDVDDEGRSIGITPYVHVRWQGEDEDDSFNSHWTGRFQDDDAPFQVDDLLVTQQATPYPFGPISLVQLEYTERYLPSKIKRGFAVAGTDPYWAAMKSMAVGGIYPTYGHLSNTERRWYREMSKKRSPDNVIAIPIERIRNPGNSWRTPITDNVLRQLGLLKETA